MNKSLNRVLLIFSSIFLFIFEMVEMFPYSNDRADGRWNIIAPSMLFLLFLVLFFQKRQIIKEHKLYVWFSALILIIYFSSLLSGGITLAFQSKSQYLTVFLPFLVLWGSKGNSISSYSVIMACVCPVFVALSLYFFSNYSIHIFEELESQNKGAYTLLYFLPFILCFHNKYLRIGGIIIILAAILFSLKRGGLVALAMAIISYWFVYLFSSNRKKHYSWSLFLSLLFIVGLILIYFYFDQMTGNLLSTRFQSLEDDGGSGRLEIYPVVWHNIINSSFFDMLFGHGWNAVKLECGMDCSAHNDFLEILYDFGLFAAVFYIFFIISFFVMTRNLIKKHSFYAAPMCSTFVLFITNSMISHIMLYPKYSILFSLFFGMISFPINKERNQKYII